MLLQSESDISLFPTNQELLAKFNLAFYEGQNQNKTNDYQIDDNNIINTPVIDDQTNFINFNEFFVNFNESSTIPSTILSSLSTIYDDIDDQYYNNYCASDDRDEDDDFSQYFNDDGNDQTNLDDIQLSDGLSVDFEDTQASFLDFDRFLRITPGDDLSTHINQEFCYQNNENAEFGHLININNDYLTIADDFDDFNRIVTTQNQALSLDDPELSPNLVLTQLDDNTNGKSDNEKRLQCEWENCYKIYETQPALVKHIEKCHVEVKRGDEFTCYWANCPRKIKPFNARYKLLIHMRVHSGEKPNKCPFDGCNKAFSRLENLKIHQRSHTGERPYLCQFPTCTKSFSNSSDRAKHQRTHFDTKPYACQVVGCMKKYTDPSSLRKHVKNHSNEEQMTVKKRNMVDLTTTNNMTVYNRRLLDSTKQKARIENYTNFEHNYSNNNDKRFVSSNIRQDLKNKISEKSRLKNRPN